MNQPLRIEPLRRFRPARVAACLRLALCAAWSTMHVWEAHSVYALPLESNLRACEDPAIPPAGAAAAAAGVGVRLLDAVRRLQCVAEGDSLAAVEARATLARLREMTR